MIDAFIIDELNRREREEEQRRDDQRPYLELPLPAPGPEELWPAENEEDRTPERGVMIIDL